MTHAPKIDTQAPDTIWADTDELTWVEADPGEVMRQWEVPYLRRDVADARAAAAAQAMREALMPTIKANCRICGGSGYSGGSGGTGNAKTTLYPCGHGVSHITPPTDASAALDRLIAERVREAVEAEREACAKILAEMALAYDKADDQGRPVALMVARNAITARGSKEGRDG